LDFTPTEKLDINGGVYYGQDHFDQDPLVVASNGYNCAGAVVAGQVGLVRDNLQCGKFMPSPIQVASIPAGSGDSGNNRVLTLAHLKVNYDVDFADLSYLGGFNRVVQREYEDFVATDLGDVFPLVYTNSIPPAAPFGSSTPSGLTARAFALFGDDDNTEDSSHELRITSKQNQPFRWSGGGDYFQSHLLTTTLAGIGLVAPVPAGQTISSINNFYAASNFLTPFGEPSPTLVTLATIQEKNYSAFGSLEYDFLPGFTAGAEYRYTRDEQFMDIVYNNFAGGTANPEPFGPIRPALFDYGNYRAYLKYKFTDDTLAYASVATGTKAGGYNTQSSLPTNQTYAPETNKTYEVGLKTTFLDRRISLEAAVYHIDSKGLQLYFPEGDGLHSVIENVGGTGNTGFELSAIFRPVARFTVTGSIAYTDPKFSSGSYDASNAGYCLQIPSCAPRVQTINKAQVIDVSGLQVPNSSKLTANLAVDYAHPIADGVDGFVHADFRYQDKQYTSVTLFDNSFTGATDHLNMRLGLIRGPFTVDVYVNNLLNDQTPLAIARNTEFTSFSGNYEFVGSLPPPRIYGAEILFHY
jgi:iron complex outermembrane receptor protein